MRWTGRNGEAVNRDGISTEKDFAGELGKRWAEAALEKEVGTGVSSVAVKGGRLYTMGNNGNTDVVFCLDAATGAEIWKHTYPQPLDARQFEGGPAGTPTVDGDKVYTLSHEGDLFCLAAASGKVLWSKNLQKDFGGSRQRHGVRWLPTGRWQSGDSRFGRRGRIDRRAG